LRGRASNAPAASQAPTRSAAGGRCCGPTASPLPTASTHVHPDPTRSRKLLLNAEEIRKLIGKVEQKGYTLVPIDLHYTKGRVKISIGLAKGKKQHDKREVEKERDWQREQQQLLRRKA